MTFTCGPGISLLFSPPLASLLILLSPTPSSNHRSIRGRLLLLTAGRPPLLQLFAVIHGSSGGDERLWTCGIAVSPPLPSPPRPSPSRRSLLVSRKMKPASALDGPRHHSIRSTSARLLRYFPLDGSSVSTSSSGLHKYLLRDKSLFSLLKNNPPPLSTSTLPQPSPTKLLLSVCTLFFYLRLCGLFLSPLRCHILPCIPPSKLILRAFLSLRRRRRRVTCSLWTT